MGKFVGCMGWVDAGEDAAKREYTDESHGVVYLWFSMFVCLTIAFTPEQIHTTQLADCHVGDLTSLNESMQTQSPFFNPIDTNPAHSLFVMFLACRPLMVRSGSAAST
jgi:hypothetical protein